MRMPTPQQLMQMFAQKVARTRAYRYTWEFQERDEKTGKLGAKQIYTLEFLQPHYRKMTIIQRDLFSNGAVLTYNPDIEKKVHARKGLIHRVYEPNDPEITRFFETDLGYILKDLQRLFVARRRSLSKARCKGSGRLTSSSLRRPKTPCSAWR